ncbi:mutator protein MutT [Actinocorallia herbida]|uniref:Mutator protein MutT n=1 Tax=Actinocorallia herbida TaxID=58109 RepID=A0A3N1CNJ9_9ACTN|nr:NUDIX hydrolase [Actinocorallia herbida]ROO82775.1 mutator protein MutT [Actinocorallia herbida]
MNIRVTGILIENDEILLLDQDTDTSRTWSLPGGKVTPGETLTQALVRELKEETGLATAPGRLLYLCDHIQTPATHILHITFEVHRIGGTLGDIPPAPDTRPIRQVKMVELTDLPSLGFTPLFTALAQSGFPDAGSYMGPKSAIGL